MNPETEKKLKSILDSREQVHQGQAALVSEQQQAQAKALADFEAKKKDVIRPANWRTGQNTNETTLTTTLVGDPTTFGRICQKTTLDGKIWKAM
jgi:hypothetical protein